MPTEHKIRLKKNKRKYQKKMLCSSESRLMKKDLRTKRQNLKLLLKKRKIKKSKMRKRKRKMMISRNTLYCLRALMNTETCGLIGVLSNLLRTNRNSKNKLLRYSPTSAKLNM